MNSKRMFSEIAIRWLLTETQDAGVKRDTMLILEQMRKMAHMIALEEGNVV